ncbi:MAG: GAF domain-containing protein [Xenococcaceae cyanobacterium MO_188.B19]|nr:GAF domain-containing protein [Xenococcaceae cyanobacterium MO_188.B19]
MSHDPSLSNAAENPQQQEDLIDLISEIIGKIHSTVDEDSILTSGVEIVYRSLKCDRVIIYHLSDRSSGKIVAEAVTPGFPQVLGTTIDDPYFKTEYIDKYQKGRVKTINDIYGSEVNPFYAKNLEKIDVKANIIAPLVNPNGTLYGLLIAHQCTQARQWQQSEINLMLQIADWIIKQLQSEIKHYTIEEKLNNFNLWQDALIGITKKISVATDTAEVLQTATSTVQEVLKCDRVVFYGLQEPTFGQIIAESTIPALAPILGRTIEDPCFEYHYLQKYQEGRVRAINNIYQAGMTPCYIETLEKIGVKSNLVAPINWDNGQIYGLLVANQCFAFREWDENETWWIKQVAFQTGFFLSKAKLLEQSQSISSSLANVEKTRDAVTITKAQIKDIQQPIQKISQTLLEIMNLNRLLAREVNLIEQSGTLQTKKDTNLIQIISKKMYINILELKKYFDFFNHKNKEMEKLLEDTARDLYKDIQQPE